LKRANNYDTIIIRCALWKAVRYVVKFNWVSLELGTITRDTDKLIGILIISGSILSGRLTPIWQPLSRSSDLPHLFFRKDELWNSMLVKL